MRNREHVMTNGQLRVAMIGHKRIPSREGGVEIVVEELSTRMVQRGYAVTCFNRSGHHVSGKAFDGEKMGEYRGVRLRYVPTIDAKGLAAVSSSFFASVRAAFGRYDVVHYHAEGPCAMLWMAKLTGKRVVATIHGLDHQRSDKWGRFARAYILLGEKMAARLADEVIVLSENAQKYFQTVYGRETVLIPNGVSRPEKREAEQIRRLFGLEKDEYILFLSRIVPEKGADYLIEAFKGLKTNKKLVIAGGASDSQEYMNRLRQMAQGDSRILFTDFVQGQVLEELYSNAWLYVLPSNLEGMPLTLLEAMSYGNCCLTSDIPECREVTGDRAAAFRRGDAADLRAKMEMLLEKPDMVQDYKRGAAEFICGKYNWDDVVGRTLELYQRKDKAKE